MANGKIKSAVLVFDCRDTEKKEPIVVCEFYDTLLLSSEFTSSSKVTAIGDNAAYVIDVPDGTYTEVNYQDRAIAGFDFDYNYGTTLLLSRFSDLHNCSLVFINENGEVISDTDTNLNGGFVLLKGKSVYTISGNKLFEYNSKGILKNELEIGSNIKQCAVLGNNAYLLGTSKIDKIGL